MGNLALAEQTAASVPTPDAGFNTLFWESADGLPYYKDDGAAVHALAGVSSVGATLPITSTGGTTPVIAINAATPALPGSMSAADKTKLDTVTAGAAVASVGATAPITSTGGVAPTIAINAATPGLPGSMSAADKTKLDTMTAGAAVASVSGTAPIVSSGGATPAISITASSAASAGSMSIVSFNKLTNIWTDAVANLGVDPTGNVDATAIIQAWHDALPAAGGATLFLPDNCFARLAGNVNLSKPDLFIFSHNRRTSGFLLTSAAANGFTCSADTIVFSTLRFIGGVAGAPAGSGAVRNGGFAVEFTSTGDSGACVNVDAIYMWSCFRSSGPLQYFEGCTAREYGANNPNGAVILIDGSGDRYVRRLLTDSTAPSAGHAGIRVAAVASLVISDCNIIHAGLALDLAPANGITVPSIECINTFFDTSVVGLNCTSAGVVARSQFTNCWFSTMSDSAIKLGPTGTGTVTGMTFTNCSMLNNLGGTTVGLNITTALVGKLEFIGCKFAGWTTGVLLIAGTAFYPKFTACVVGGYGIFANNTTGFNIGAGTYAGIQIQGCETVDNTTPLTLGAVTATGGRYRIVDNPGINPRSTSVAPAVPATTVVATNTTGFRVKMFIKAGTLTVITINGVISGIAAGAGATLAHSIYLEPGGTVAITYTVAPTWVWITD